MTKQSNAAAVAPSAAKVPAKRVAGKGHNKPPVSADLPQEVQAELQAYSATLLGFVSKQAEADTLKGTAQTRLLSLLMNDKVWGFELRLPLSGGKSTVLKLSGRDQLGDIKGGANAYWIATRALFGIPSDGASKGKFKTQFLAAYAVAECVRREKVSVTVEGKSLRFKAPVRGASPLAKSLVNADNFAKAWDLAKDKPVTPKGAKTGTTATKALNVDGAFSLAAKAVLGGYIPSGATLDNLRLIVRHLQGHLD